VQALGSSRRVVGGRRGRAVRAIRRQVRLFW